MDRSSELIGLTESVFEVRDRQRQSADLRQKEEEHNTPSVVWMHM